ncbi:hypothetical protein GF319_01260 [Candidatus Bathyarchaeota archaeon]|nr:hypothetical protein [Candidatus Bathyarchaeota archaeon]
MKLTAIYYFSGTGNSYAVARDISEKLDGEMIPIAKLEASDDIRVSENILGLVFPDYHSSLPNIVRRFVNKLENIQETYVFGVCTNGGTGPGLTMMNLKEAIENRQGELAAGFAVRMPYNYIIPSLNFGNPIIRVKLNTESQEKQQTKFSEWNKRFEEIVKFVEQRETGFFEASGELILNVIDRLGLRDTLGRYIWMSFAGYNGETLNSFNENWRFMDYGFFADEACITCGTCEKICSVGNIEMKNEKPSWNHKCEHCFACLQWCPKSAIQFGDKMKKQLRYHHPKVESTDLILNNENVRT